MDKKQLEAFTREAAKSINTESDLNDFRQMLTNLTVQVVLNAELGDHLGYDSYAKIPSDNSRNGDSSKTLQTEDGQFEIDAP